MTMRRILLAGLLAIVACTTAPDKAVTVLEDMGYRDVEITGLDYWGCGSKQFSPMEMTGFLATAPSGRMVKGTLCHNVLGEWDVSLYH
jgi:hypothetical protein